MLVVIDEEEEERKRLELEEIERKAKEEADIEAAFLKDPKNKGKKYVKKEEKKVEPTPSQTPVPVEV